MTFCKSAVDIFQSSAHFVFWKRENSIDDEACPRLAGSIVFLTSNEQS
jgi:hypothetical protein